nr:RNA-directed DNA polymerase, eukaryota [Tanacetum cinerariifolium]
MKNNQYLNLTIFFTAVAMAATVTAGVSTITTIGTTVPTVITHVAIAVAPFATSSAALATFLGDTAGSTFSTTTFKLCDTYRILDQGGSNEELIKGDENTKFFHCILNIKCSQLAIHRTLVDEEWIVDLLAVKSVFLKYFSTQFTSPVFTRIFFVDQFTNRLSLEQQADLERNVSNEKIKSAVWDCGTNKSLGPDGFTFEFFRRYWKLLEHDCNNSTLVDEEWIVDLLAVKSVFLKYFSTQFTSPVFTRIFFVDQFTN